MYTRKALATTEVSVIYQHYFFVGGWKSQVAVSTFFFGEPRRIRTTENCPENPARQSTPPPPCVCQIQLLLRQNIPPPAPTSTHHHAMRCPQVHHLGHHASYTSQLNAVLEHLRWNPELKHLAKMGVDELLHNLELVPEGALPCASC